MDKEQEKKINTTHEDQPAKEHLKVKSIIFWNSNLNCRLEQEIRAWTLTWFLLYGVVLRYFQSSMDEYLDQI